MIKTITQQQIKRIRLSLFWQSKRGKALKKRLHAKRNNKGRFTPKETEGKP